MKYVIKSSGYELFIIESEIPILPGDYVIDPNTGEQLHIDRRIFRSVDSSKLGMLSHYTVLEGKLDTPVILIGSSPEKTFPRQHVVRKSTVVSDFLKALRKLVEEADTIGD